uniref:Lysosome-associated membrane glycoprotein 1 n=1 Tax=Schistosoma haematobium TaxID=6185 RepID=A0A095C0H2_SCHHA
MLVTVSKHTINVFREKKLANSFCMRNNRKFRSSSSENSNVGQRCEVYFRDSRPSQTDNEYSQPTYDLHGRTDSEGFSNASGAFTMSNLPYLIEVDGNVGELQNYTFIPKTTSSNVHTNETIKSDNQLISINLVMSTEGSKLQKCVLLLTVEQDEEYFAWTNMTLIYQFAERLSTLSQSELPISEAKISTSSDQKFLTRTDEVYVCDTEIPIKFGHNVEIIFNSMTFQAFKAEETIRPDRLREVCPRDFKSNIPITALTGVSLLVVVVLIVSVFGINAYLAHRKRKQH